MESVNLLAVVLAAISAFVAGGIWYSPLLYSKAWQRETGLTNEQLQKANKVKTFTGAFAFSLLAAYVFALFLGPSPGLGHATGWGFAAGLFWVAGSLAITYLFELRSVTLFLINGGYAVVQFTLYGAVIGAMG
jgi:hypothetical protein